MQFSLPPDGLIYTEFVLSRSKDLIAQNIWHGIEENRLTRWLNNFQGDLQRYFAARILDALMYRSDDQTKSMVTHLFQRTLPDLARSRSLPLDLACAFESLQSDVDPLIRIVPVTPTNQAEMASGPLVTRLVRRHLELNKNWILQPAAAARTSKFVVFIDDFIGTGCQFRKFIKHRSLAHLLHNRQCCYVALAAHSEGVRNLKHGIPPSPRLWRRVSNTPAQHLS